MSNWKKIIVSGSHAHLSSVTASNGSIISGSLTMSGSITNVDNLNFYTTSSAAGAVGRFVWNDVDGTLDLGLKGGNVTLAVGEQTFARVYNGEGTTLNKGEVVYISGSQGNRILVKRADYSAEAGSSNTLGFVAETITSGDEGFVITNGVFGKLNTVGLTGGSLLYLSSSGQYTQTKTVAPQHTVILGYVERVHATVGSIYVKIDNGYELGELHNVLTNGVTNGDLLAYSGSIWTHTKQLSGSYGLTGSLQATSFTGSLQGSASYALQSLSSSFATNSSTASYVLNAVSSSFATTASYVLGGAGSSFSVNNPVNGRVLLSDGTTNAATASANLYFTGIPNTLIISSSLVVSGTSVFEEDVAINNTRTLGVSKIKPNNGSLIITGSVYHNSGSFVYTPTFVDYQEKFTTVGIVSPPGNLDLDINNGNVFAVTIDGAITNFTISNPPFGGNAGNIVLITTGNGTTYPITWPASVSWPGGTPPTVTSTNGKKDVYGFISLNQGTNWYGFIGGQNI